MPPAHSYQPTESTGSYKLEDPLSTRSRLTGLTVDTETGVGEAPYPDAVAPDTGCVYRHLRFHRDVDTGYAAIATVVEVSRFA